MTVYENIAFPLSNKKVKNIKGLNDVSNSIEKNLDYIYLYLFGSESISIYSLKDKKVKNTIINPSCY